MHRVAPGRHASARQQRGAISLLAAAAIGVSIASMAVIDVAHVFSERRAMQRVADLSALSGAQLLDAGCSRPQSNADSIAAANQLAVSAGDQITVTCGRWDPNRFPAPTYFSAGTSLYNAVYVTVSHNVPYFFLFGSRTVTAQATAKTVNVASFSLGTGTAAVSGGLTNQVLNALLGANLNVTAATYSGLAGSSIQMSNLVTQLNAGTVQGLLNTQMSVGTLWTGVANVLQTTDPLSANLLKGMALQIPGGQVISLGKRAGLNGLFNISLANVESALTTQVNVLDILMTSAEIAGAGKPPVALGASINLAPVATASTSLAIIQPPVIAIGEAGQNAAGVWLTSSNSAQVRLLMDISLLNVGSLGIGGLTVLHLPLVLDVAPGTANLTATKCTQSRSTCEVDVVSTPGLARACLGDFSAAELSTAGAPLDCTHAATLANVPGVIKVTATAPIPLTVSPQATTTFKFNGVLGDGDDYQTSNSNAVGGVLSNTLSTLTSQLTLNVTVLGLGLPLGSVLKPLLTTFVDNALSPLLNQLDAVVVPLLHLLGVQIGYNTVHYLSLECGDAELVY